MKLTRVTVVHCVPNFASTERRPEDFRVDGDVVYAGIKRVDCCILPLACLRTALAGFFTPVNFMSFLENRQLTQLFLFSEIKSRVGGIGRRDVEFFF